MAIDLVRIDDRLVHGQVIEGWLRNMSITRIVVANDAVAEDETQQALYQLGIPHGIRLDCLSLKEAAKAWTSGRWKSDRVLVLLAQPADLVPLIQDGVHLSTVNVGGVHYRTGRVQVLKAVSLDAKDVEALLWVSEKGVVLEARPLPLDEPIDLLPYLKQWATRGSTEQAN